MRSSSSSSSALCARSLSCQASTFQSRSASNRATGTKWALRLLTASLYDASSSIEASDTCRIYCSQIEQSVLRCATHSKSGLNIHLQCSFRLGIHPRALGLMDLSRSAGERPGGMDASPGGMDASPCPLPSMVSSSSVGMSVRVVVVGE